MGVAFVRVELQRECYFTIFTAADLPQNLPLMIVLTVLRDEEHSKYRLEPSKASMQRMQTIQVVKSLVNSRN